MDLENILEHHIAGDSSALQSTSFFLLWGVFIPLKDSAQAWAVKYSF